jgi:prolipoprotein diacylglyceryl transferase
MFIHNISPELFSIGPATVRWYGLLFVIGIILNYFFTMWVFKRENYPLKDLDSIAIYLLVGLVVGARFGHIVFYNLPYFLENPIEIFQIWKGGLASHGAAIGVLVAYLVWILVHKIQFTKYADYFVLGMPITAGFVRIGNFFNSEIIGRPTDSSWGVVFQKLGEEVPRHPSQIYEALLSFGIFIILFILYKKYNSKLPKLFILFTYTFLYFLTRFIVEFWKEKHIITDDFPLSQGQLLSILPVLIAFAYFIYLFIKREKLIK